MIGEEGVVLVEAGEHLTFGHRVAIVIAPEGQPGVDHGEMAIEHFGAADKSPRVEIIGLIAESRCDLTDSLP